MARATETDGWIAVFRLARVAGCVLLGVFVFSMFYPKIREFSELEQRQASLDQEFQLETEKLKMLKHKQERLRTDKDFAESVAREEFGYVQPGEKVIKFIDDEPAAGSPP